MKKFILFFFAMVLGFATGMAREVVFNAAVSPGVNEYNDGDGSYVAADQSVTIDGVTIASPACVWYNVDPTKNQYRIYKGKDLTITSTVGPIVKVEFSCIASGTTKYGPGCFAEMDGYSYEGKIGVWTGEAEELVFHSESNQVRAEKIVVTLADPADPVVFSDVVDGGVYAIVNVQPLNPVKFYVLESVDGELTTQSADDLKGSTKYAQTAQFKAIELEDGRFAFQNVANGEYLAWRNHNGQGGNNNCGFNPEINELSSWTMNDGTVFADYRTYWFYVNARNENGGGKGTLIIGNDGNWNGWGATECTGRTDFSNDYGFVACATEVDLTKSNVAAINQADFVEPGKWYLLKQKRGVVSPVHDEGVGATMKRAANDNVVVEGSDAADAVDYLLRFIPTENEGAYNLQFANGHYWASTMTTTEEEPGEYNVYNINGEATHIGINLYNMNKIVDNNGAGNTLAFWDSGEVKELNGNNDWTVWEVEFAPKTTAASDLKALIKTVEEAYALNNLAELGDNLITETSQFSSPFTEPSEGDINALIDGDCSTFWHSAWSQGVADMHVHYLQVDLPEAITGDLQVTLGRRKNQGSFCANDNVVLLGVEASADGETFAEVGQIPMPLVNGEWYERGVVTVENAKVFRFFNDESNGTSQRGYWHAGEFQLNLVTTPALNVTFAEAAAAFAEALAAAKAVGASATDADVAALQAAYDAYVAALGATPVEPEPTPVTFEIAENEDGTFTVTPSDLEATYFYNVYSPALRNQWYGGAEANECVKVDVENYISEPETETHKGVSVVEPASWLKAFYGAEYPYGDYQLVVVAIDQVGGGYAVAGDVLVHNYTYAAPEAPEVTFPEEGKAYVVTNKDSKLFLNIVADDTKAAVLTAQPEKIFFVKKGEGFLIKDEEGNMIGGHAKNWNVAYDIEQVWNVVEVEGGYAFQRADDNSKYLGFDKIEVNPDDFFATAGFRDKNYANAHGVFTIAEYTFPLQGVAYKVKNVDAGLYMNITSADAKNVTIEKTPQEIFFTVAEDGGFYIQNAEHAYVGAGANDWTVANTPATWNVVEVEGGYAFQRTDATNKYLGLDSVQEGSAYFRDKGAAAHYAHLIMLFDTPETTPAEDLAAAIAEAQKVTSAAYAGVPADLFEDLAEAIEEAKPFANEDAAVSDINDQLAALEAAVNAIKNYVPETAEELLARLQAAVAAGKAIVKDNTVEDKCMGGLPGYKALDLVQAVASDVEAYDGATTVTRDEVVAVEHNVKYYNKALPCIPEVGKTYIIRNHPTRFGDQYSYVITAGEEGRELIPYSKVKDNVEDKHLWTVSEHVFKVEDDWGDVLFSETRYVFTNVATGQIFGYNGAKLDLCEKETDMNCWYFTQKTPKEIFAGSTELPYGTLGLQYNDGGNKYKYTTVDMRTSDLNISGSDVPMHALWNTYSSAFIFDVYEPEVTEWDGQAPTVAVEDATTVKVTFTDANSVEATNFGVLAAIYDEQGDVYGIVFNDLFGETVEFEGSTATLSFKKISEINAELAASAKAMSNKVLSAVDGVDVKGKVVICGKSFKIDGTTVYTKPIVAEFDFNAGGIATGLDTIATDADAKIFDLQGRRVLNTKNGLLIRDGKKVVR